ncbi:hypothetical protein [Phaeocystidibacter marisrubri]|uniref:Uncharacterized protein n=1 Tax=Phaeocystidibacter marisrubri TaxID=1577780 RepID=A0A6L3ZDK0_9FLAO|nr:hypothetical protein [Phaeocystidibacter marisrubri]KAB2815514.1 hypothetical protein F8C82_07350 [Phaeocystidibacter marisrubri]
MILAVVITWSAIILHFDVHYPHGLDSNSRLARVKKGIGHHIACSAQLIEVGSEAVSDVFTAV